MDEKDCKILVAIHEEKNITKAAEKLYTSQPSLTYRLQQIEQNFGVKIVIRNKKGLQFTSEGEYLVHYAKTMLLDLQKTRDYLLNMSNNIEGIIRIGASSNFARYRLPKILKEFCEKYPHVQFNLKTGWSSDIVKLIQSEKVHIGIIRGDYNWYDSSVVLEEEKMCIISKTTFDQQTLPKMPRIHYHTDPLLDQLIENWWYRKFQEPPNVSMEVDNLETCKEMVINGLGYAVVPTICLKPEDDLNMIHLFNENNKILKRKTSLIYRRTELEFPVVKTFIDFLQNSFGRNET